MPRQATASRLPTTNRVQAAKLAFVAAETARTVGEAIRARRTELHLTQSELADRVERYLIDKGKRRPGQPFDPQNISRWERGAHLGTTDNLEALAASLETTMGALMDPSESGNDGGSGDEPTLRDVVERLERIEQMNAERLPEKDQIAQLEEYLRDELRSHFDDSVATVLKETRQILSQLNNGVKSSVDKVDGLEPRVTNIEDSVAKLDQLVLLMAGLMTAGAEARQADRRAQLRREVEARSRSPREDRDSAPPEAESGNG